MKLYKLAPLALTVSLVSCESLIQGEAFYFDTYISYKLFDGSKDNENELNSLLSYYDKISDNYRKRGEVINVTDINATNEDIEISERLYHLLESAFFTGEYGATNFNPMCGSLSKAWKTSLANKELLSSEVINTELNKINNSSLLFKDNYTVQRVGEAEIDLGGIAKGYVLDEIASYFKFANVNHYLVNAGMSSILLGEKNSGDGYFNVGIDSRIIANSYIKAKNCFISTSALNTQGVQLEEGGPIYSHIINPVTGSALNNQEAVIVISDNGSKGDALSTSMMLNTLEEIKEIERNQNIKVIVINNKSITYKSEGIEVLHR